MFVTRKSHDTISSLNLLKIKLEAALRYNKIIGELDLIITLDDQITDFNKMTKANNTTSSNRSQIFWAQKFMHSPWGHFISNHTMYIQDIEEIIDTLLQLKQSYFNEWKLLLGTTETIEKNDFYKQLNNEITKAQTLFDNLRALDIKKYQQKSKHMLALSQESLPPTDRSVEGADKTQRAALYRTKERDLYLTFRKMLNAIKNISNPLIEDIGSETKIQKSIVDTTNTLKDFVKQLEQTTDSIKIAEIRAKFGEWQKSHHTEMENINQLKQYMFECSYIVYDFAKALKSIEEVISKKIVNFNKTFMLGNTEHRKLLLYNIIMMIKTHNYEHFDQIYAAVKHNSYGIQKIKGLNLYVEYLRMARDRNIPQGTLNDYLKIHESQYQFTDLNLTKLSLPSKIHHKELNLLLNFDTALISLNKLLSEKNELSSRLRP